MRWALAPFPGAVPRNLVSELRSGGAHGRNTDVEDIRVVRPSSRMTRAQSESDEWVRRGNGLFMCIEETTSREGRPGWR